MPVRTRFAHGAALVALAALLAGCAQDSSAGERVVTDVAEQGYVSGDGTTTIVAEAERVPAPALTGTTLDGAPFALADHLPRNDMGKIDRHRLAEGLRSGPPGGVAS